MQTENGEIEMADSNVEVKLKNVRLSFLNVFPPQKRYNDAKELVGYNYNTNILLDKVKDAEQIQRVKDAMKEARMARWGDNPPKMQPDKLCLREGEPKDPDTDVPEPLYDGYAGCMYVSSNRPVNLETYDDIKKGDKDVPVSVIGPRRGANGKFSQLKDNSEFAPYSGCYANVIIRIYGYKSDDNPNRINASLEAIQFNGHGERFSSATPIDVDDAFDEVDDFDDMDATSAAASASDDLLG